jgi:hypothetical protein
MRFALMSPAPTSTLRFGYVGTHAQGCQIDQRLLL